VNFVAQQVGGKGAAGPTWHKPEQRRIEAGGGLLSVKGWVEQRL